MKIILSILISIKISICIGQNLVPNPGFENFDTCPNYVAQIHRATPWFTPTNGSPDYFNTCTNYSSVDVPQNFFGYQYPDSGNAYVGLGSRNFWIDSFFGTLFTEYIEVKLDSTLIAGTKYYFNLNFSLADSMNYSSDELGIYFSNDSVLAYGGFGLNANPQFENPAGNFLVEKNGWAQIGGSYVASGGENFITIGNFQRHYNNNTFPVGGGSQGFVDYDGAYYYIDNVYLSTDSIPFDYYYSNVGIQGLDNSKLVTIYPNPFSDFLNIETHCNEPLKIILYDLTSRISLQQNLTNSAVINTQQLEKGLYFYEILNNDCVIKKGKIIKQ